MRTSDQLARVIVIGLGLGLTPAVPLDGTPRDGPAPVGIDRVTPAPAAPAVTIERLPPAAAPARPASIAAPSRSLDIPRPPGSVPGAAAAGRAPTLTPVEAFRS